MTRLVTVALLAFATTVSAQAPELDPESRQVIWDMVSLDKAFASTEALALEAVKKTPEFQRFEQAQKARKAAQADIQKRVAGKAPGFQLNFKTYQLEPAPMP